MFSLSTAPPVIPQAQSMPPPQTAPARHDPSRRGDFEALELPSSAATRRAQTTPNGESAHQPDSLRISLDISEVTTPRAVWESEFEDADAGQEDDRGPHPTNTALTSNFSKEASAGRAEPDDSVPADPGVLQGVSGRVLASARRGNAPAPTDAQHTGALSSGQGFGCPSTKVRWSRGLESHELL